LIESTIDHFGQLDILVNNAGTIRRAPATDYSEEDWATVIEVNLSSVFRMAQLAGRHMIGRGGGKILNIASLLSFQGGITVPAYAASKGGVRNLTKALANEWAAKNINVNAIAPGYMRTENTEALQQDETRNRQILERIPAARWGEPSDLGGAAVFSMFSGERLRQRSCAVGGTVAGWKVNDLMTSAPKARNVTAWGNAPGNGQ
jgi:2-deoxy-D-gluconate 3-dehydrogenase